MDRAKRTQGAQRKSPPLPLARALREGSYLAPKGPTLTRRVVYNSRRLRAGGVVVATHIFGLFPIVAAMLLIFGLAYGAAMSASP